MSLDKLVDSIQLDADLTAVANAIRTKGGTTAQLAFPSGFVSAISAISGGGSGYQKATGSFVPSTDYTYANHPTTAYTGMLIDTGLTHVDAAIIWSEEWANEEATTNCFGLSCGFDNGVAVDAGVNNILHYYSGASFMRNGTNNYAAGVAQGIVFHSFNSGVPEGQFGIKCFNVNYPILAGHTIHWEAYGQGDSVPTGGG